MRNIIKHAIRVLEEQAKYHDVYATNVNDVKHYLRLRLASYEHEVFAVMFLTNQHQLIQYEEVFRGTIDSASVHPREIAKLALHYNAAAVVLAHNHPSEFVQPSESDKNITNKIIDSLKLIETRVLDHFIVSKTSAYSFAEQGLL